MQPDDVIETHGSFYHKSCFLCGICSKSLVCDVIVMGVDKIPNCVNCYESLHAKLCSKCDKKIGKTNVYSIIFYMSECSQ